MNYPFLHPPFPVIPFREMTKKEATRHFEWFVGEVPTRLQLLREVFEFTGGGEPQLLDYSPESLKLLWRWFLPLIKMVPKTQSEIDTDLHALPEWLREIAPPDEEKLSQETLCISTDIAIYFAEVFLRNHTSLRWDIILKPKNDLDYHRPVVFGFGKVTLPPLRVLNVRTSKAAEGDLDPNALYNLYHIWLENLPEVER